MRSSAISVLARRVVASSGIYRDAATLSSALKISSGAHPPGSCVKSGKQKPTACIETLRMLPFVGLKSLLSHTVSSTFRLLQSSRTPERMKSHTASAVAGWWCQLMIVKSWPEACQATPNPEPPGPDIQD